MFEVRVVFGSSVTFPPPPVDKGCWQDMQFLKDEGFDTVNITKTRFCLESGDLYLSRGNFEKFVQCLRLWRVSDDPPRDPEVTIDCDLASPMIWQCCPTMDDESAADEARAGTVQRSLARV